MIREARPGIELPQLKTNPILWGPLRDLCLEVLGLADSKAERPGPASPRLSDFTILVAEDTPINRAVISKQLEALGYPHTMVADGEEALAALDKAHFDLLLADCHMPNLDGFELTRRIRQSEQDGRHLPIIALSASALPEQTQACSNAGMDGFLAKPATLKDLDTTLAPYARAIRGGTTADLPDGLEEEAAHLLSFYKDPEQIRMTLRELLAFCATDMTELEQVIGTGNEARQRFLLHRIEGSLGVAGDAAPLNATASTQECVEFITERLTQISALLHKLKSDRAARP